MASRRNVLRSTRRARRKAEAVVDTAVRTYLNGLKTSIAESVVLFGPTMSFARADAKPLTFHSIMNLSAWIQEWIKTLTPAVQAAVLEGFKHGGRVVSFKGQYSAELPLAREAVRELVSKAKGLPLAVGQKLDPVLTKGFVDGASFTELAEMLVATIDELTPNKALLIARTAGGGGQSAGQVQAFQQAGIAFHIWRSQRVGNRRNEHLDMDGERVAVGKPFSNGLRWPRDYNGAAGDIINCQCYTQPEA